jgi:hypothetical protein
MIRNEVFANGVCVAAQIVDLGAGTLTVEDHGVVVSSRALTSDEIVAWTPPPPTDAERLAAATAALAPLETVDAPYTTADIVDVLLDVKTALGG